jgi:DNA-binding transcriptional MocR family regulator
VALLARYNVMLIEDDVYSELYLAAKTAAGKVLGSQDMTLHCSSFSKCLVPGFRIGWVAAANTPTHSAAAADEHALHQFADAAGAGGLPVDQAL